MQLRGTKEMQPRGTKETQLRGIKEMPCRQSGQGWSSLQSGQSLSPVEGGAIDVDGRHAGWGRDRNFLACKVDGTALAALKR